MTVSERSDSPSITTIRARVKSLLEGEVLAGRRTPVVILAIDGLSYALVEPAWQSASLSRMHSVFPTTSSAAWLSSMSGIDVHEHGVPGVVFRLPDGSLIDVFQYRGDLASPVNENLFSDAAAIGYSPVCVTGDLEPLDCSWRDLLLRHCRQVGGHPFFATPRVEPATVCRELRHVINDLLSEESNAPKLVWCFLDADRYIHRNGYDGEIMAFLAGVEGLALSLASRGVAVAVHSDHGLVVTEHRPEIQQFFDRLQPEFGCAVGGAGRTRWLYPRPRTEDRVVAALRRELPSNVRIQCADEIFGKSTLARQRVGPLVVIADGEDFITFEGHRFEHGSAMESETYVPFAVWSPL